jgi:hypothetical protein
MKLIVALILALAGGPQHIERNRLPAAPLLHSAVGLGNPGRRFESFTDLIVKMIVGYHFDF